MNWRKWLDEFSLAAKGIILASKEPRFWYGFIPSFILFGILMNLLAGGFAKFKLMGALGFPESLTIIWSAFIALFGIGQPFLDWLPVFALCLLQSTLIGLIVLLWDKKRLQPTQTTKATKAKSAKAKSAKNKSVKATQSTDTTNSANVEKAGIITGLIALGAGCPTCGTTLLTPLLGTFFSTGGIAIAGTISTLVTILAIIIAVLSLQRLGLESYVIIINEKYLKKHAKEL